MYDPGFFNPFKFFFSKYFLPKKREKGWLRGLEGLGPGPMGEIGLNSLNK
jgi:hypothetical protein